MIPSGSSKGGNSRKWAAKLENFGRCWVESIGRCLTGQGWHASRLHLLGGTFPLVDAAAPWQFVPRTPFPGRHLVQPGGLGISDPGPTSIMVQGEVSDGLRRCSSMPSWATSHHRGLADPAGGQGAAGRSQCVRSGQGRSKRTAMAAAAITALSWPSSSGTSRPPFTALAVTTP